MWVGYDRPRSLGKDETGSRVAAPIWVTYMGKVLGDSPNEDFTVPERVVLLPLAFSRATASQETFLTAARHLSASATVLSRNRAFIFVTTPAKYK